MKRLADLIRNAVGVGRDLWRLGVLFPWASEANRRVAQHAVEMESYFLRMEAIGYGYEEARARLEALRAVYRQSPFVNDSDALQDAFGKALAERPTQ